MSDFRIKYDLIWTFEDKQTEGCYQDVDADDAYNAVATLQYLLGGNVKADIVSVELNDPEDKE